MDSYTNRDEELEHTHLDPHEWRYICEGNAKVAFAYTGSDLQFAGWVLRLNKCFLDDENEVSSNQDTLLKEIEYLQKNNTFEIDVIGSLIGVQYILPQRSTYVTHIFLSQLNELAASTRPSHRANTHIDTRQQIGVLVPNMLTSLAPTPAPGVHTITVELKPKWGFLTKSTLISDKNSIKRRVCRYCMHQYTKHDADNRSTFCPLDLFSDDYKRVVYALDCLALSPQNNIRVFVGGQILSAPLQLCLEGVPLWDKLKHTLARIILAEGILIKLKHLQSSLDSLDIEGVFPRYQRAVKSGTLADEEPTLNDWVNTVAEFRRTNDICGHANGSERRINDKQAVLEFLLSTVLKDISIMIAVEQIPSQSASSRTAAELPKYRIAIVDTEPKKLSKMSVYLERYQRIVSNYLESHPDPDKQKHCQE
ncbi:DUF941-domain-containing protein [Coemansia reversa NRRL 1564]|uniref:Inositol-pentakisphosphate 2-kinase n=1 Tax=Coemansia reversa (strain ATCC 12441 / NRRL 1564) TaxID=763665 RepID=A0A2G5B4Y2_COERN|nr:DUF941-domain-containing protein [Coemansia reversa NRRL 1564]|eukprot:PIA13777.1 DUF941-domain-containing protein [Coemansia reversa NRRL 1564]